MRSISELPQPDQDRRRVGGIHAFPLSPLRAYLVLVLLAALFLTGCGGGSGDQAPTLGPGITASDITTCLHVEHGWSSEGVSVSPSLHMLFHGASAPSSQGQPDQGVTINDEKPGHPAEYDFRIEGTDGHAVDVATTGGVQALAGGGVSVQPLTDGQKAQVYDCAASPAGSL